MQRLSSWFEQLPLRRRGSSRRLQNCDSGLHPHKRQSKSVAPRLHYSVSAVQSSNYRDHSVDALSQSLIINDQLHVSYYEFLVVRRVKLIEVMCSRNISTYNIFIYSVTSFQFSSIAA
ncbi:unnamed protein product, partial [Brugia timori]|uniref:Ovule protein n=1 Tax=Brugia timori TaxID=42155 RepID=A0A0R3R7M9_9BILA